MSRDRNDEANPARKGEPETAELLAYLDDEVAARRRLEIAHAIETSPSVQLRLDELQRDILLHSELSASELPSSVPGVDEALRDLTLRLQREHDSHVAAEAALRVDFSHGRQFFHSRWLRLAACTVVSAGIAAYWLGRGPLTHVLAHDVIDRAASAEERSYNAIAAPVIHQRLQAARRGAHARSDNAASWELWSRVDGPESREEVKLISSGTSEPALFIAPVVSELKEVFRTNGVDSRHPLSTTAYSNWRKANRVEDVLEPTRTEKGDIALVITSTAMEPSTSDSLRETEFTVRMSDWHIIGERMKVQAGGELRQYELTETSYEVVSLGTLPSTVFEASAPAVPDRAPQPIAAPPLPTPVREFLPENALSAQENQHNEIVAAAIEIQYALHKLHACTEEQITVHLTSDSEILVQGSVLDQQRWQQIADGLSGLRAKPVLQISILNGTSQPTTRSDTSPTAADRALIHATALYLLSEGKYALDVDALPRDSRWLMEIMVRDHLEEIAKSLSEVMRSSAIAPPVETDSVAPFQSTWPGGAASLLQDVRALDATLHTSTQILNTTGEPSQRTLLRLMSLLSDPAALAARWFPVTPAKLPATATNRN